MHIANAARYVELAPDLFRVPGDEGLVDFFERGIIEDAGRPEFLALVAEVEGEVAGYLEASLVPPLETASRQSGRDHADTRLHINALGTNPEFQRQGVATKLVEAAEEWGRVRGATIATCETWIDSPMSVPFWERRMGYKRHEVVFRKRL